MLEREWILNWLKSHSHVRSGRENFIVFNTFGFYLAAYRQYLVDWSKSEFGTKARCFRIFLRFCKLLKIHVSRFDRYACRKCYDPLWPQERKDLYNETDEEIKEAIADHKNLIGIQNARCRWLRTNLPRDEILIIWDYSRIHDTAVWKMHDLNMTVYLRTGRGKGTITTQSYDFFCESKHDYHYSIRGWEQFRASVDLEKYSKVHIWSDNGLKSKEIFWYFNLLKTYCNLDIELNYFTPCHGHSDCDGHFGQGKQILRNQLGPAPLSDRAALVEAFMMLPNTTAVLMDTPEPVIVKAKALKNGIRYFYSFKFDNESNVICRKHCESENYVVSKIQADAAAIVLV